MVYNILRTVGYKAVALPSDAYMVDIRGYLRKFEINGNIPSVGQNGAVCFERYCNNPGVFSLKKRLNVRLGNGKILRALEKLPVER